MSSSFPCVLNSLRAGVALLLGLVVTQTLVGEELITVRPAVDDALLINPGKGWVQYGKPSDHYTPTMIGCGYARFDWAVLEPEEGAYVWAPVDEALARFKTYGKKTIIGVMNASVHSGVYCTPKWVFDAGAESIEYDNPYKKTPRQISPKNWQSDQVFQTKMQHFIAAFGARYAGHPDVAAVDIRSYGNWGEGHLGGIPNQQALVPATPDVLRDAYITPYLKAFPATWLLLPWGRGDYDGIYDWATAQGRVGMRRDGILSQWSPNGKECLRSLGHAPAAFEFCWNYRETKANGWWRPEVLIHSIRTGRPTYIQWYDDLYEENQDLCRTIGNLVGYHFVVAEATYPARVKAGGTMSISFSWRNDGVAPCYEPAVAAVVLLDPADRVVARQTLDGVDLRTWKPEETTKFTRPVPFPVVPAGDYRLAVGVLGKEADSAPTFRIGNQGRTAEGWYVLGGVQVLDH